MFNEEEEKSSALHIFLQFSGAELSSQESLWCCPNGSLACQPWFLRDFLTT